MTRTGWAAVAVMALGCARGSPAAALAEGERAPAFRAMGDDGHEYSLAALAGRFVVLYFYPKDDTPGCTVEAQGFRDEAKALEARGAVVLGVSTDDAESHRAFRAKHGLNFPLLTDGKAIAQAYGVPLRLGYALRQTFVVGRNGKILKIYRDVDPRGHAADVLRLLAREAS